MLCGKNVVYISVKTRCIRKKHVRSLGRLCGEEVVQQFRTIFYKEFVLLLVHKAFNAPFFSLNSILKSIDTHIEKDKQFKWAYLYVPM